MPARHYNSQYNINGGPWLPGNLDEVPGPGRQIAITGLGAGTYAVKVRGVDPSTGEVTLPPSNELIMQVGNPSLSDPVQTLAEAVPTVADVVQRRDALLAAVGVTVSAQDAQVMNEALLSTATEAGGIVVGFSETVTALGSTEATVTTVQTMLEQVVAAITAADSAGSAAIRVDAAASTADVVPSQTDTLTHPSDTTAPVVTAFTAGTPSGSTVPITTFTATDAVGVTGYLITESATPPAAGAAGWTGTAPTNYTAVGTGSVTLYAWAKDAAGNVSTAATQTVTIGAGGPVTLSFESADIVDSQGVTWTKNVPTAVSEGVVGSITSGVIGGDSGNALSITPSIFDDGYDYYGMDTYISRVMDLAAGDITAKFKIPASGSPRGYIQINGETWAMTSATYGNYQIVTLNIPAPRTGVTVKIGARLGNYSAILCDSVSIPV